MRVIYPGAPGAFAHAACQRLFPSEEVVPVPTFEAVARTLAIGEADYGVLPVRNNIAGDVPGVSELIQDFNLCVSASLELPINLHLLGVPGSTLEGLTEVISHPVALAQCRRSLNELGLKQSPAMSTALAARDICNFPMAAIASIRAAELYNLIILRHDIQDRSSVTRFVAVHIEGRAATGHIRSRRS